jgi:chromosome segregation ATPase
MKTTTQLKTQLTDTEAELAKVEQDIAEKKAALSSIAVANPRQAAQMAPAIVVLEGRREGLTTALAGTRKEIEERAAFEKSKDYRDAEKRMTEHEANLRTSADELCAGLYQIRARLDSVMKSHSEFAHDVSKYRTDLDPAQREAKIRFNYDYLYLIGALNFLAGYQKMAEYGNRIDRNHPDKLLR